MHRSTLFNLVATAFGFIALAASAPAFAAQGGNGGGGQASLFVSCGGMNICNTTNTSWDITKTSDVGDSVPSPSSVSWTVTVTQGATSSAVIGFNGSLTVTNTGTAPATIGNIVVNLQRKPKNTNTWVSASADVADATHGDAATTANICYGASSENLSTFTENAYSGSLNFTNAADDTIWSITPQQTIQPQGSLVLVYHANFDFAAMQTAGLFKVGDQARVEVIVSFGNAGPRSGSGVACSGVDINGSGTLSADETYVRSVPCRTTITIPAVVADNTSVVLTDTDPPDISATGTVTWSGFSTTIGAGSGSETISATNPALPPVIRSVSLNADGGAIGGLITNVANILGSASSYIDPAGNQAFCNPPVDADASSTVAITVTQGCTGDGCGQCTPGVDCPPPVGCTYTQGGWGSPPNGSGNPGTLLTNLFSGTYGASLTIGQTGNFHMQFTDPKYITGYSSAPPHPTKIPGYLPAGGTPDALDANLVNPQTSSSGVLGGQVLALKLNVDLLVPSIGGLTLFGTGTSLDGSTVSQILAAAQVALGGGTLPSGYTYSSLNDLLTNFNEGFDSCSVDGWAKAHLYLAPTTP